MDLDEDEDGSFSQISCGPNCMAPKVLVGVIKTEVLDRKNHYLMQLSIVNTDMEWGVSRRYSEFLDLRDDLKLFFTYSGVNQCFGCRWFSQSLQAFDFPRKHVFTSKSSDVVRYRKWSLDRFVRMVVAHTFSAIPKCVKCSVTPFDRITEFFTRNALVPPGHPSASRIRKALTPERFASILDPSKSKLEFRRGYGILRVLQVEKSICNTWREHEEAARQRRLGRRMTSTSQQSLSLPPSSPAIEMVDGDHDEEEEKAPTAPRAVYEDGDVDFTGIPGVEIDATSCARRLQPLRKPTSQLTVRPDGSLWEAWELASPTRTAAKEA